MKVFLNWLKEYIDIDYSFEEVLVMFIGIGLEEEGMEWVESICGGLEGVVVGYVFECG